MKGDIPSGPVTDPKQADPEGYDSEVYDSLSLSRREEKLIYDQGRAAALSLHACVWR